MVLALGLVWLGWQSLAGSDLYRAVLLFMGLGILMALTWGRLGAPDLALAEAAIGTGLTGALFLQAVHQAVAAERAGSHPHPDRYGGGRPARTIIAVIAVLALAAGAGAALLQLPPESPGLWPLVDQALPRSGVSNPVTAVLLNFRGYDTLLEIGVLLAAGLICWSLPAPARPGPSAEPALRALAGLVQPLLLLMAGYVLWVGSKAPGGAFQAGALLAGGGVLQILASGRTFRDRLVLRLAIGIGLLVFLAAGVVPVLGGSPFLAFPPPRAGAIILAIEAASALSIGALLTLMYQGGLSR